MTVPAAQQCTHGGCDREATDPTDSVPVCDNHLEAIRNGKDIEDDKNSDSDADHAEFAGEWSNADFANPGHDIYPDELLEREQWMGRADKSGKQPFAPWGDENAPVECSRAGHTTADKCDCDARWKWGYSDHYVTAEELEMLIEDPKFRETVDGRVFIQQEDDRVVDAPTALGKSYTTASTRWGARDDITGGRPGPPPRDDRRP
ncbi:hypothetical protein [Natrinema gelatinilyticum]|uniref:hypothetical protein n=1 Tax=Natrinema gelatinilyticum TaxID=2961571 RepID=UPI0020C3C7D7|nr:hypothetical protein [Natrinema gelatinilyticum]